MLRRLIRVNEEIANACYQHKESVEEIMNTTEKRIFDVIQKKSTDEYVPIQDVVLSVIDKIEAAARHKGTVTGLATGFYDLDYKIRPSALRSDSYCCQTIYGKDGLCSESGPVYVCAQSCADSNFQLGNVEGSAGQSYSLHGIQSGFPVHANGDTSAG